MALSNKIRRLALIAKRQPLSFPRFVGQRLKSKMSSDRARHRAGYVSHYGAWHGNAGDVMIAYAQHALLDCEIGKQSWSFEEHKDKVTSVDVERINAHAKVVMVGGGGLLIPDRHRRSPNVDSDWQWNISIADLKAFTKPVVIFGVGYNRMKGHDEFKPYFHDHISATVEKAAFFGLRNSSSIEAVSRYIPSSLADKLILQPCPTNVMSMIEPEKWAARRDPTRRDVVFVLFMGFKAAGIVEDREKIRRVARQAKRMAADGWRIHIATHTVDELDALPAFHDEGVPFNLCMIDMLAPADVVKYYREKTLVIGMRGHGVMLPYGLGVPVFGVVNHPKVRFFLEEVKLGDLAINLDEVHLEDAINEKVLAFEDNRDAMYRRIDLEKKRLWKVTQDNMGRLRPCFS